MTSPPAKTDAPIPASPTPDAPAPASPVIPIRLWRDYWDETGERHAQGTEVRVDLDTAKALIAEGKAERADPFPGEERDGPDQN